MQVTLYNNFSKRNNSTKLPTGSGRTVNVNAKSVINYENPVLMLDGNIEQSYNYMYFEGRYYFIDNMERGINNITMVYASEDVLATHKNEILAYNCFVERNATTYDNLINDSALSSKQQMIDVRSAQSDASADYFDTTGCYVVRCVSGEGGEGITTYAIEPDLLARALSYLYNNKQSVLDALTTDDTRVLALYNPLDYIASCKWYPFNINQFAGRTGTFHVAWWNTGVGCRILSGEGVDRSIPITYPSNHYYSDWRRFNPQFTQCYIYLPGVGNVSIPSIYLSSQLYVRAIADVVSGQIQYVIQEFDGRTVDGVIMSVVGQVGIDVGLGQVNSATFQEAASSFTSAIADVVQGDFVNATLNPINTLLQQTPNSIGSSGGSTSIKTLPYIYITEVSYASAEYPNTVGRPLMRNVNLGSLTGYTKCGNASIDIGGFGNEKAQVNSFLNSGFYIE